MFKLFRKKTKWEKVTNYFRKINKDVTVSQYLKKVGIDESRANEYRCVLERAGFIYSVDRGIYRKTIDIPRDLTYRQCRRIAYENSNETIFITS